MNNAAPDAVAELVAASNAEKLIIRALPGLRAWIIVALHSRLLGHGTGGTRLQAYASVQDAVADALRLSEAMTLKLAVAGLPCGGGKTVIAFETPPTAALRSALLEAYAETLIGFDGQFQTGPDVNTTPADMDLLARRTPYVFCRSELEGGSGDSARHTAQGVVHAIRASLSSTLATPKLAQRTMLVQDVGSVGAHVARLAAAEGARVIASDLELDRARQLAATIDAEVVTAGAATETECDVYAPCALGGTLSSATIPQLRCRIVAGAANNQLATPADAQRLDATGILYAPDFVANAGGVLYAIATERLGWFGIILSTVGIGFVVSYVHAKNQLDEESGQQSLTIARTVASIPEIKRAFAASHPQKIIDPIAERIRHMTRASFVVVANRRGIRFSHPNPKMLGKSLLHDPGENPAPVLAGREVIVTEKGSLGASVRAKVPIYSLDGRKVIGLVSVGVLQRTLAGKLRSDLPVILIPPLLGLALGAIGSVLLARRIKRQIFGLEPEEIATALEQREAMLHGIREGAVTLNVSGQITLLNDEAKRLLGLDEDAIGRRIPEVFPSGRVRDVLLGKIHERDQVVVVGDRVLVTNYVPVEVRGKQIGAVVTLRDRTELDSLLRQLDDVRNLAEALRAQEHEFAHRLHVISGLIELGRYDDAIHFITSSTESHQALAAALTQSVGDQVLVALLLGKAIIGNLVDNGLDAAAMNGAGGIVELSFAADDRGLAICVHDSGPGVDPGVVEDIFKDGFTTKATRGEARRGLGLALVSQAVRRRGGRITVEHRDGALFTVYLARPATATQLVEPALA
jgi:two-component system, CitB family, sensor kinase